MKLFTTAVIAALSGGAVAHGGVISYFIDGKNYTGFDWTAPTADQGNLIQRTWHMNPLSDPASTNLTCNNKGEIVAGAFHATVTAGSRIRTTWGSTLHSYGWVHTKGPVMAYMASCGNDCTTVDPSTLNWFKIAEEGLRKEFAVGQDEGWFQSELFENQQTPYWEVSVPESLKPGRYMIRHEIINLELAPVQFYPNCAHLEVKGNGQSVPGEEYYVKFPGAYSFNDPGIAISGNVSGNKVTKNYTIPGPRVWSG